MKPDLSSSDTGRQSPIRVVAVMEAHTVTGPAKNLIRFSRMAREHNCEVSLLTFFRSHSLSQPASNRFIDAVRAAGLTIDLIHERRVFDLGVLPKLRALFGERAPDIIQTHGTKSHFLIRLTRPSHVPWISYHHGHTTPDFKMRVYNQLDRWSLPAADRVVTVCTPFADMLVTKGVKRARIAVLPNSIERSDPGSRREPSTLCADWKPSGPAQIILTVGRLSDEKGQRYLVSALNILRQKHPELDFRLLLVGEGPERHDLQAQVDQYGLRDRVCFIGHQQDVMPYYGLADLFVLPSLSEGSPNVLLEAMMAKTAIVACAVGGVPETVEHGQSALLVPPRDPSALAQAIATVLQNLELANTLRANAHEVVLSRFSPEAYCSGLIALYRDLLANR